MAGLCGSSGNGVKRQKEIHGFIRVEKAEFLPGLPEFRMEPCPFRRIEMDFKIVEKTLVFLHGLPVFDHSAEPPCNYLACDTS